MVENAIAFALIPFRRVSSGSIPFGLLLARLFGGGTSAKAGSGNIGATKRAVSWDRWRGFLRWHSTLRRVRPLSGSLGASLAKAPRG